jgi:hypothetical protein
MALTAFSAMRIFVILTGALKRRDLGAVWELLGIGQRAAVRRRAKWKSEV